MTGPGAGRTPEVRQFDVAGVPVNAAFNAYEPSFTGGVRVAVGDTNGNGIADIITGTGRTGGPRVRGFNPTDTRVTFDRFVFDGVGSDGLFVG